jgi:uncharacterized protein (DUF2267 family)
VDENKFLNEIEARTGLSRDKAFNVAIAVLQELHDRLSPKEANDLAAQLPGDLKARWRSFDAPGRDVRRTHRDDFVRHIAAAAEIGQRQAGEALLATFKTLQILLGSPTGQEGEAWSVFSQLPKDLKRAWLQATESAPLKTSKAAKTDRRQNTGFERR